MPVEWGRPQKWLGGRTTPSDPTAGNVPVAVGGFPQIVTGDPGDPQQRRTGWVSIRQLSPILDKNKRLMFTHKPIDPELTTHLGDGPAIVTEGYGGWTTTARPRNKALTVWEGVNGFTMAVPLLISGWFDDSSIESRVRRLEQMARADEGASEPPKVQILLPGDSPRDGNSYIWVISGLEWGDSRRRDLDGHRIYQEATLTVMEYVRPDVVKLSPSKARKVSKKKKKGEFDGLDLSTVVTGQDWRSLG